MRYHQALESFKESLLCKWENYPFYRFVYLQIRLHIGSLQSKRHPYNLLILLM